MHDTTQQAIALLRSLDARLDLRLDHQEEFSCIHLPPAAGADYRFVLYIHADGEPQIAAVVADGDPDSYFWSWPFEEPEFATHAERERDFLSAVRRLVTGRSRIRQKRGWLFTHFRCELEANGTWSRVGPSQAGLRSSFKPPPTSTKVAFYESAPLIPNLSPS